MLRVASEPASLKLVFVVDFNVSHHYGQLLFVDVNPGYPIRHKLPPGGSGERAGDYIKQGLGLSPLPQGRDNAPFIRSITHAPDQTDTRSQLLHCFLDLATPNHSGLLSTAK